MAFVIVRAFILGRLPGVLWRAAGIFLGIVLAAALGGCATSVNSLSKAELGTIYIEEIDIKYKPDAEIWWGTAEREYAAKIAPPSATSKPGKSATEVKTVPGDDEGDAYRELMSTPEAKAYLRDKLAGMIKDRLTHFVLPDYKGTRPVRLEVEVHGFFIPSPLQRVALGGAPTLGTVTVLRDAATGKELAKLDKMNAGVAFGGVLGVAIDQAGDDLEDRVLDSYVTNVRTWLSAT